MRTLVMIALTLIVFIGFSGAVSSSAAADPVGTVAAPGFVLVQQAGEKKCRTVLRCRFERGGVYRGCISAFSCRECSFGERRCRIIDGERICDYPMRCRWGAPPSGTS